jgi:7-keto-8-aminopelargonate synthetase-like enzyme
MTNPQLPNPNFTLAAPLQQVDRTYVRFGRTRLSYFGGCDYFRLSTQPALRRALLTGLKKFGLTVAASRSTTGNHEIYERLESRLAQFFDAPAAVLLSSGYLGNLALAQALAGTFSHALIDDRAHPSLVDAAVFLDCPVIKFSHRAPADAASALRRIGPAAKPFLLTDGLFPHDGAVAPLAEYLRVLPRDGSILVDDAHGAGVLGKTGQGTIQETGSSRRQVIQTIALSKAFGAYGGAVLCSHELRERIVAQSRLFNGNTPLPLPLASAALKAIDLLSSSKSLRLRLRRNTQSIKAALKKMGYAVPDTPSPIIPLIPRNPDDVPRMKACFIADGIFPSFIKYPGAPAQGYFRFALSSEHTPKQLAALVQSFRELRPLLLH